MRVEQRGGICKTVQLHNVEGNHRWWEDDRSAFSSAHKCFFVISMAIIMLWCSGMRNTSEGSWIVYKVVAKC